MAKSDKPSRIHVTPQQDGNWNAVPGGRRPIGTFDTQAEAQKAAKDFLQTHGGGELTTHRRNGLIRDSDTIAPAKDPFPPKG